MKRTATSLTLGISVLFLAVLVSPVFAESKTTVNVNNSTGGNTVCVNGKCTTTDGGSGESNVCVNGECWDSANGDVNYQSEDGNTKVNIKSDTDSSVAVQQNSSETTKSTVNVTNDAKDIEPTIKQEVKAAKDLLQAKKAEAEQKIAEKTEGFNIMSFIQAELEEIKSFFTLEFIFGKN